MLPSSRPLFLTHSVVCKSHNLVRCRSLRSRKNPPRLNTLVATRMVWGTHAAAWQTPPGLRVLTSRRHTGKARLPPPGCMGTSKAQARDSATGTVASRTPALLALHATESLTVS